MFKYWYKQRYSGLVYLAWSMSRNVSHKSFDLRNFVHHKIPDLLECEHGRNRWTTRRNDRLSETAIKSWLVLPPSPRALGFYALIIGGFDMIRSRRIDYENRTLETLVRNAFCDNNVINHLFERKRWRWLNLAVVRVRFIMARDSTAAMWFCGKNRRRRRHRLNDTISRVICENYMIFTVTIDNPDLLFNSLNMKTLRRKQGMSLYF